MATEKEIMTEGSKMMSTEKEMIPLGTVAAYSRVVLEHQGLGLEIDKLGAFLDNPKYVSDEMLAQMRKQHHAMLLYKEQLGLRLLTFEKENNGIKEYSIGRNTVGTFNPSGDKQVEEIKNRAAQLINCIDTFGKDPRRNAIAITDIEKAQMMAVKSKFN